MKQYNYNETINVDKETLQKVRKLLEVENFELLLEEEMEALGAKEDDSIPMFAITFDNGNTLFCDIHSGSSNYYDDVWMEYADKNESSTVYDCMYELPNEIVVIDKYNNSYCVTLVEH